MNWKNFDGKTNQENNPETIKPNLSKKTLKRQK